MPSAELHDLTLAEAAHLISVRKLSPVEYTASLLARTEALDPQLNAFITRTPEVAMAAARTAEAEIMHGNLRGPLHGIPFALKDIYDTAGILTSGHSRTCIDRIPDKDATTAARLKAAGAVLTGKLATHEFAHGGPSFDLPWPPARNPWNTAHFTGGSSSGSGAALAARLVPASLGSDTGGSIRGPAGLCGIAGLKPTYGLVSRAGVLPNSYSYDHCGPMARTSQDCALLLNAIAGHDPADPASSSRPVEDFAKGIDGGVKGLRIGIVRHFWERDLPVNAELSAALEEALEVLRKLGARTEDVTMRPLQTYSDVKIVMAETELFSLHLPELIARAGTFGQDFRARSLAACLFTAEDYVRASRERRAMIEEMQALVSPLRPPSDGERLTGAAARRARSAGLLAAAELHLAVQLHRRPGACPAVWLLEGRVAAVAADRRPAARGCPRSARGPCLRDDDGIVQARAGSKARCGTGRA